MSTTENTTITSEINQTEQSLISADLSGAVFNTEVNIYQGPRSGRSGGGHKAERPHRAPAPATVQGKSLTGKAALPGIVPQWDYLSEDQRVTLKDPDGDGALVIVRDRETGATTTVIDDKKVRATFKSNEAGIITGDRKVPYGFSGIENHRMSVKAGATFPTGVAYCDDHINPLTEWFDNDQQAANNKRVGQMAVGELQRFFDRNPALAKAAEQLVDPHDKKTFPLTNFEGRTVDAAKIGQLPKQKAQLCPTGKDNEVVKF